VLLLLLHSLGALQQDPMTFAFKFFASVMPVPVRLPSVFIPTRKTDKPMPSVPVVP